MPQRQCFYAPTFFFLLQNLFFHLLRELQHERHVAQGGFRFEAKL